MIPLQMARKDMFTTDPSTGGKATVSVLESGRMAQLAPVASAAPVPPQNLEAEESVLGAMMISPGAIGAVSEILDAGDFYRESHAKIYRAALALYAKGEPVDAITLTDELEERGELEDVGGRVRLHELAALVPATANAVPLRADRPRDGDAARPDPRRRRDRAARLGAARRDRRPRRPGRADRLRPLAAARHGRVVARSSRCSRRASSASPRCTSPASSSPATPSGFRDLDRLTSGFQPGNLIIVAARPSMGKSALALCMAANIGVRHDIPVGLFTLEMSKSEVTQRLMCSEAKVESQRLRNGKLAPDDWPRLTAACDKLAKAPIYVDDTGLAQHDGDPVEGAAAQVPPAGSRADRRRLPPADDPSQRRDSENRVQEVSEISRKPQDPRPRPRRADRRALAALARGRAAHDKRPILSDLRESGSIEQDADLVAFIYRDEYYNEESDQQGLAEVILAKHRNGPTDSIKLSFLKRYAKFSDLAAA